MKGSSEMKIHILILASVLMILVAGCGTQASLKDPQELETLRNSAVIIRTTLNGSAAFPTVNGKAKYKTDRGNREFEVEIEDIPRRLVGKRLRVFVDGKRVGSMIVTNLREARLKRSTQLGQAVPNVTKGSVVAVKRIRRLVASGTF